MSKMLVPQNENNLLYNHSSLYCDLIETKTYLEKLRAEQPEIALNFNTWSDHRKSTIEKVDSLQKKIDAIFVSCNAAKGAGAAAGMIAVGAWVLGTVLKWKGHSSAAQLLLTSKYCAGASTATFASSSLLEFGLTESSMNEIERVIKKDVELTRSLQGWIQSSKKVESIFHQMFQCNVISSTFAVIMKVCGYCIEMLDAGIVEVDDLVCDLQACKLKDMESLSRQVSQIAVDFFRRVQKNPRLLTPMKEICKIFQETPYVFDFVKLGTQMYCKCYQMINSGRLSIILNLAGIRCPDFNSLFTDCVLHTVALASHVVTFKIAVKNIQEGKSKYSESLDKLKTELLSELVEVTKKMINPVRHENSKYEDILALRFLNIQHPVSVVY